MNQTKYKSKQHEQAGLLLYFLFTAFFFFLSGARWQQVFRGSVMFPSEMMSRTRLALYIPAFVLG